MTPEIGAKEEAVITLKGARSGDVALRQNGKQNKTKQNPGSGGRSETPEGTEEAG